MGGMGGLCPYKHGVRLMVDLVGFGHVGGGHGGLWLVELGGERGPEGWLPRQGAERVSEEGGCKVS
jgi:hypothetical protein